MEDIDLEILKTEFPDNWKKLTEKLAYPHEYFNSFGNHQKSVENLKKEGFFNKLKKKYPDEKEIERTKEILKNIF